MDLREDIKKVTSLPLINDDAEFFLLRGLSQAAMDRKMNERKVRKPRNIRLLEDSDSDNDTDSNNCINSKVKPSFDKHAISAAIKEVNGSVNLSNKHWEKIWAEQLELMNKSGKEKPWTFSTYNDTKAQTGDVQVDTKNLKCKLQRNAAFMGLVNIKKISLEDLLNVNNGNLHEQRKENESKCMEPLEAMFNDATGSTGRTDLIPLHEDPEILVHPLRMGIDPKQFTDIDFSVAHIGKKIKETPQQYFLRTTNDESFNFVKRQKKKDNSAMKI